MSHLGDDLFESDTTSRGGPDHRRPADRRRRPARRRRAVTTVVMLLAVLLVAGGAALSVDSLRSALPDLPGIGSSAPEDYAGPGQGEVEVTIRSGSSGAQIGESLQQQDVVKSAAAFTAVASAEPDKAAAIQPGVYQLRGQMSAGEAFDALADPSNRVAQGVTLAEGMWRTEIYDKLAEATGTPRADYDAAERSGQLDLPAEAGGDVEGWLFPATYEFEDDASALEQLQTLVSKTTAQLQEAGVERADWERTLTVASIVEGESGAADRAKVARVVENRLRDTDGPTVGRLQMDSTVHYIFGERGRAGTSDEMRASDSPYNTYRVKGLPPGPINNPGAAAISAAADPEPGDWLFFVTVDPDTGETKFARTKDEHDRNVAQFQQWCRTHTDRC